MSQEDKKIEDKRVVYAPQLANLSALASVLSVELSNDEEVEWQWTHFPNRQKYY